MSITNLGKRKYELLRDVSGLGSGGWVDGEWVEATKEIIPFIANIQPSTLSYRTQMLPSGEREKEAIAIYSNDWLHTATTGASPVASDLILYRGAQWKVVVTKPYGNFGNHCEALAIKLDDTLIYRLSGKMDKEIT